MKIEILNTKLRITLVILSSFSIFVIGGFLGFQIWMEGEVDKSNNANEINIENGFLSLVSPSFSTTFLDEEAGISLYTDLGYSLDLSIARTVYKTIEVETSDYIIGSISLPGLSETDDIHCFVHKDGWIVAYYLKTEPVSKIIDWNSYSDGSLSKTKLQIGVDEMCVALIQQTITNANYYHFHYPFANKGMLIIETQQGEGTGSFNLKLPSEFIFYERSWSHRAGGGTITNCGSFTAIQLGLDTFHTVEAYVDQVSYGWFDSYLKLNGNTISYQHYDADYQGELMISEVGIALVYKEPQ